MRRAGKRRFRSVGDSGYSFGRSKRRRDGHRCAFGESCHVETFLWRFARNGRKKTREDFSWRAFDKPLRAQKNRIKSGLLLLHIYGMSGQYLLLFAMFSDAGITRRLLSTCKPQTNLLLIGTMWSTCHLIPVSTPLFLAS